MGFSVDFKQALESDAFESLLEDSFQASGLSSFAIDHQGSFLSKVHGAFPSAESEPSFFSFFKKWAVKACVFVSVSKKNSLLAFPGGLAFGAVPLLDGENAQGIILLGPVKGEGGKGLPDALEVERDPDLISGKPQERLSNEEVCRELSAVACIASAKKVMALASLLHMSLQWFWEERNLLPKEEVLASAERQDTEAAAKEGLNPLEAEVFGKLRHALQRHVYRECENIIRERIYLIYDMERDEEERYRRLADFFLILAKVSSSFHAPLEGAILKDIESNAFVKTLTKGRYFVFRMASGYLDQAFSAMDKGFEYTNTLDRAINFIDSHIRENISLEQAAAKADLNTYYFSRMFKKNMSVNFVTYVSSKKMDIAAEMLLYTDLPVADIAAEVSYGIDTGYFSKSFKKYFGITPKEFRTTSRKAKEKEAEEEEYLEKNRNISYQTRGAGLWNRHLIL